MTRPSPPPTDHAPDRILLKWAGGKSKLAPMILDMLGPVAEWTAYHEPFAGSLAVARMSGAECPMHIADASAHIRGFWSAVIAHPILVADALDAMPQERPDRAGYEAIRAALNAGPVGTPEHAARFLWINRAGFNGLWRENRGGACNVPCGRQSSFVMPSRRTIVEAGNALALASIHASYAAWWRGEIRPGDRVYLDPPYCGTFTGYSAAWARSDRINMAADARLMAGYGATVVISDQDGPEAREDYAAFGPPAAVIPTRRSISQNGAKRETVGEALWVVRP